jgi:hypothetical protein
MVIASALTLKTDSCSFDFPGQIFYVYLLTYSGGEFCLDFFIAPYESLPLAETSTLASMSIARVGNKCKVLQEGRNVKSLMVNKLK